MSYKQCRTAQELNQLTQEERHTRCGFSNFNWSQSGSYQSTANGWRDSFIHTKQNTCRDKQQLKLVLTPSQVEILREGYCDELQLTTLLADLQKQLEDSYE